MKPTGCECFSVVGSCKQTEIKPKTSLDFQLQLLVYSERGKNILRFSSFQDEPTQDLWIGPPVNTETNIQRVRKRRSYCQNEVTFTCRLETAEGGVISLCSSKGLRGVEPGR